MIRETFHLKRMGCLSFGPLKFLVILAKNSIVEKIWQYKQSISNGIKNRLVAGKVMPYYKSPNGPAGGRFRGYAAL